MIVDKLNELADSKELSGADNSEVYDLQQQSPTPGLNGILHMVTTVEEGASGKLQVKIQDCDTEDGTFEDVLVGAEVELKPEGTLIDLPIPGATKRFIRAAYVPASGAKATVTTIITWGVESQTGWTGSTAYMQTK